MFISVSIQKKYFSSWMLCLIRQKWIRSSEIFHSIFEITIKVMDPPCCSVPELCSVLGSGSVFALHCWLSSVLDCRGSDKLPGFSLVMSVSSITTTRACSFSFSISQPSCMFCFTCVSHSSLRSIASTELALSMLRSGRLPSGSTSLKTRQKLLHKNTHEHATLGTDLY